jgi:hypothetical protein
MRTGPPQCEDQCLAGVGPCARDHGDLLASFWRGMPSRNEDGSGRVLTRFAVDSWKELFPHAICAALTLPLS